MGRLVFYHGCMCAGKSTSLLTKFDDYKRRKKKPIIIKPVIDNRDGCFSGWGITKSRVIKFEEPAYYFSDLEKELNGLDFGALFVDEVQFLTRDDVLFLGKIADERDIDVFCYGLKVDVNFRLFDGAAALLALCDEEHEIETLCQIDGCNRKAIAHIRYINGERDMSGKSVAIETGDVTYKSVCRKHWMM